MRFLRIVSCCGPPVTLPEIPEDAEKAAPRREESRSLMAGRKHRPKKRGRAGGASAEEWKPSLGAISEDNVVAEKREKTSEERERAVKWKSSPGGSRSRVHIRNYCDCRRDAVQTAIPAFSPTPFMF